MPRSHWVWTPTVAIFEAEDAESDAGEIAEAADEVDRQLQLSAHIHRLIDEYEVEKPLRRTGQDVYSAYSRRAIK